MGNIMMMGHKLLIGLALLTACTSTSGVTPGLSTADGQSDSGAADSNTGDAGPSDASVADSVGVDGDAAQASDSANDLQATDGSDALLPPGDGGADVGPIDGGVPDATLPDATLPDAVGPDSTGPDGIGPDGVGPDGQSDTGITDAIASDGAVVDAVPADQSGSDVYSVCCNGFQGCAAGQVCVQDKACVPKPAAGSCWQDSDCAGGQVCDGAFICPCTADCMPSAQLGVCKPPAPICTCQGLACAAGLTCLGAQQVCVSPSVLKVGQCWSDSDCGNGSCSGASICPCGVACALADSPGTCNQPVCSCEGKPCPSDSVCTAKGICEQTSGLKAGQCWTDAQCAAGSSCTGANICPCGAMCFVADKPGTCSSSSACVIVGPGAFGLCDMVIGWVFDGKSCGLVSGCGCGSLCGAVFKDEASCQSACGV